MINNSEYCDYDIVQMVMEDCEKRFKIPDITNKCRRQRYSEARHIAIYVAHKLTKLRPAELGEIFANRDRTTILNSLHRVAINPALMSRASVVAAAVKKVCAPF